MKKNTLQSRYLGSSQTKSSDSVVALDDKDEVSLFRLEDVELVHAGPRKVENLNMNNKQKVENFVKNQAAKAKTGIPIFRLIQGRKNGRFS